MDRTKRQTLGTALGLAATFAASVVTAQVKAAKDDTAKEGATPPATRDGKIVLRGAGATFPAPLYQRWMREYAKTHPDVAIEYASVGSGEGARRFLEQQVDFGASDAALTDAQIAGAENGAALIPMTAGMVALTYNLPGANEPLRFSRTAYLDLIAGLIPSWDDARIQATNPGIALPKRSIVLVARQDSSGTTHALTSHLAAISNKWTTRLGRAVGTQVDWPGAMLARGNEGVAARIKQSVGAVGYVEHGFARRLGLQVALLQNKAGTFVAPTPEAGQAALAGASKDLPDNLRLFIPDPEADDAYPIVSLSWLLLRERGPDPARTEALKAFVDWSLGDGQALSQEHGYVPLPAALVARARAAAARIR